MTHIFGQSFPGHQTSTPEEEFVMAVDPSTEQILHYQKTDSVNKLRFPLVRYRSNLQCIMRLDKNEIIVVEIDSVNSLVQLDNTHV